MNRQLRRAQEKQGSDKSYDRRAAMAKKASAKRSSPGQYLGEVRGELRKVSWPSWNEVLHSTVIVIVAIVIATSFIWVTDLGSSKFVFFLFD